MSSAPAAGQLAITNSPDPNERHIGDVSPTTYTPPIVTSNDNDTQHNNDTQPGHHPSMKSNLSSQLTSSRSNSTLSPTVSANSFDKSDHLLSSVTRLTSRKQGSRSKEAIHFNSSYDDNSEKLPASTPTSFRSGSGSAGASLSDHESHHSNTQPGTSPVPISISPSASPTPGSSTRKSLDNSHLPHSLHFTALDRHLGTTQSSVSSYGSATTPPECSSQLSASNLSTDSAPQVRSHSTTLPATQHLLTAASSSNIHQPHHHSISGLPSTSGGGGGKGGKGGKGGGGGKGRGEGGGLTCKMLLSKSTIPAHAFSSSLRSDAEYSPRSSVISLDRLNNGSGHNVLKDNYKGFHANRRPTGIDNVPPLTSPITPKFKKRSGFLGKLIANRKDSNSLAHNNNVDESGELPNPQNSRANSVFSSGHRSSVGQDYTRKSSNASTSSAHSKFRLPSLAFEHLSHHHGSNAPWNLENSAHMTPSGQATLHTPGSRAVSDANPSSSTASFFNLDATLNLNDLSGIVKTKKDSEGNVANPSDAPSEVVSIDLQSTQDTNAAAIRRASSTPGIALNSDITSSQAGGGLPNPHEHQKSIWMAPDSWDVKGNDLISSDLPETGSDSDNDEDFTEKPSKEESKVTTRSEQVMVTKPTENERIPLGSPLSSTLEVNKKSLLPVLYGSKTLQQVVIPEAKKKNHIIRIFREDNTFTTILCSLEITAIELLPIVQKKFFLENIRNYQITAYIGNCVKVLEPFEKPLKIQMGLLILSGYLDKDNLNLIGRQDLSFLCKFVLENVSLRNLTRDEETLLSKDYVNVNISGLNLKNIPIVFHQHTYEIEKLNVGDNPGVYVPLDFIQSSTNLTSIIFSCNGCSKFPMNFLEARRLTYLDLEKNFLDEIPSKISHLENLTHLKLNSNQLSTLPKSFGKLKNLVSLNISSNSLTHYPEAISDLVNLVELDLSYNDLHSLPESVGNLTKLSKLNLCSNKLNKVLPIHIGQLVSLKRLDIRYNYITNMDVLGSLPNLEVLYASKNNLSAFVDKMERLKLLHFDKNPITLLEFENKLPNLTVLNLSRAKITSIPSEFISNIPYVERLVLDKNHLVNLPNEIGSLKKLTSLSVYGNNLQVLPNTLSELSNLQYLDLHSNNLQMLPDDIWSMKSLTFLNISSNILTTFPNPPIEVVKSITSGGVFRDMDKTPSPANDLTPDQSRRPSSQTPLDDQVSPKTMVANNILLLAGSSEDDIKSDSRKSLGHSLQFLIMSDNRLTNDVFESVLFLSQLMSLNLSYNELLEIPPGTLGRLSNITDIYLSGNDITALPDDIENLKQLKLLFINNNKLVSLPAELSKLLLLQHLDVGSNLLRYNIANWPYDWNWHWNKNLRFLNFAGNKRFEIKQSHVKNPETGEYFDSLLVLKNLKVLNLIDVTLTTPAVPDQNIDMRIRTTASELDNVGYGVADTMGLRDVVSTRDIFIQKYRGNEDEVLFCSFDGKLGHSSHGHRISDVAKKLLVAKFTEELNGLSGKDTVEDAIRRAFLSLNREINGILAAKKYGHFVATPEMSKSMVDLNLNDDALSGCAIAFIYIKDKNLYSANIGDLEAVLSRGNGTHVMLTTKHDPTTRTEFERIRAAGGYVSGDGTLDGELLISRGVGFFKHLPHTHCGPDIEHVTLNTADDVLVIATHVLWDYISYDIAVDILRQEKDNPTLAAEKLRDFAISYGATDKICVNVITFGQKLKKSSGLYNNLVRDLDSYGYKKKREKSQFGDSELRRLEEEISPPVGELALVFTDIKNSTLLWDAYPVAMRSAIKTHNQIMRRQLRIIGGYEVKTEGDAFMVSFPTPTAALLWCFTVQQQLLTADWPSEILDSDHCCPIADPKGEIIFRGLSVRMGIHWGLPVCETDMVTGRMDYFGPMVNRSARIQGVADGGQIAISADFYSEMHTLYEIHRRVLVGESTLEQEYGDNIVAGEIIEKEIESIEESKISYVDIGDKKLKGLEAPEPITLAYPKKLEYRYELFKKELDNSDEDVSVIRYVGSLPVEAIFQLRTLSMRLENVCGFLSGSKTKEDSFAMNSSKIIGSKMEGSLREKDMISLLSHVVTRIEHCVQDIQLRVEMNKFNGGDGSLYSNAIRPMSSIMEEFSKLVQAYQELKSKAT